MNHRRKFLYQLSGAIVGMSFLLESCAALNVKSSKKKPLKAEHLRKGDLIGIVAPASSIKPNVVEEFKNSLEGLGFRVKVGKHVLEEYGDLAGSDKARAEDINEMFSDKEVKGIFSIRGGWGSARILPLIDYDNIRQNPKVLMGYSDISALLVAVYIKTGLITFHGPMGYDYWDSFTTNYFVQLLMENQKIVFQNPPLYRDYLHTITKGKAEGIFIGGNLSVLSALVGTNYLPRNWKEYVLFLEEVSEETYRIDRMITHLKLAGVLSSIKGFVFGQCKNCHPEDPSNSFTFQQVLEDHLKPLQIPSFSGAMFGHIAQKFTLPIGARVCLDADNHTISLQENVLV